MESFPRRTWGERVENLGRTQAGLPVQGSAASAGLRPEPGGSAAWAGVELRCDRIRADDKPDDRRAPLMDAPPSSSSSSSFSVLSFLAISRPPPSIACSSPPGVALQKEMAVIDNNLNSRNKIDKGEETVVTWRACRSNRDVLR